MADTSDFIPPGDFAAATESVLAVDSAITRSSGSGAFGITDDGFISKPFARILAEKLTLARALLGEEVDLTAGSVIRKILEVSALEDARTWAALASMYDDAFISTATGAALSRLGDELALPRPHLEARGTVKLKLKGTPPTTFNPLLFPRGTRLSTPGGHHITLDESVSLSPAAPEKDVPVVAFYPGPDHNLDPAKADPDGSFPQKIAGFNGDDELNLENYTGAIAAMTAAGQDPIEVTIVHTQPLTGGELFWPDTRYRDLLLKAPRSIWTVDAIEVAVSLVPGVRRVQVRDAWGGLDIRQSIFGNFNFIERLFSQERDLGSPYYFTVLVAPAPGAIWDGTGGLDNAIQSAIEDLHPIGIFPNIAHAESIFVSVAAELIVKGLPLPSGNKQFVNDSQPAKALKARLLARIRRYIDSLDLGEPVRAAEVTWAMMSEPGIADVQNLRLMQFPAGIDPSRAFAESTGKTWDCGENVPVQATQIAAFVSDDDSGLVIK